MVSGEMDYMMINKQTHKIAPASEHKKRLFTSNGYAVTFIITSFIAIVQGPLNMVMMIFIAVVTITVMAILLHSTAH